MSWRIEIRHTTHYEYPKDVVSSYNEARLTPVSDEGQRCISSLVEVAPASRLFRYIDAWGTTVHSFDVHIPHRELTVTASAVVDTAPARIADPDDALTWSDLHAVRDDWYEFLAPSRHAPAHAELAETAERLRSDSATPHSAVEAVVGWVHDALVYERGTTNVSSSAVEAWKAGRGVCQDFVHLSCVLLRSVGVPARYVSGYFHPNADAMVDETSRYESHAWAEAWTGQWQAFDPTNRVPVGERHVVLARGRDYADVVPLKGVYSGAASSSSLVTVELTRLA